MVSQHYSLCPVTFQPLLTHILPLPTCLTATAQPNTIVVPCVWLWGRNESYKKKLDFLMSYGQAISSKNGEAHPLS